MPCDCNGCQPESASTTAAVHQGEALVIVCLVVRFTIKTADDERVLVRARQRQRRGTLVRIIDTSTAARQATPPTVNPMASTRRPRS
jgi:hypothetical protein